MKKFILILIATIFSYLNYAQTTIHPTSNKKIKVFENEAFSFQYPKRWKKSTKFIFKEKPIIKIVLSTISESKTYKIHFDVFSTTTKFKNLKEFIMDRKRNYLEARQNDPYSTKLMLINKIDTTHYIEKLRIIGKDGNYLTQYHLIHYYFKNDKIYNLAYSATPDYYDKYLADIDLIVNSLKFKDL